MFLFDCSQEFNDCCHKADFFIYNGRILKLSISNNNYNVGSIVGCIFIHLLKQYCIKVSKTLYAVDSKYELPVKNWFELNCEIYEITTLT